MVQSRHTLNIDWPLLHEQKLTLLDIMIRKEAPTNEQLDQLEGILSLIDVLQDQAEAQGIWDHPEKGGGE